MAFRNRVTTRDPCNDARGGGGCRTNTFCSAVAFRRLRLVTEANQAAMLPALVVAAGAGWVTQMQSKYGATAAHAAEIWAGNLSDTDSQVFKTIGYYWHAPEDVDSNRGLGCAAQSPTRH